MQPLRQTQATKGRLVAISTSFRTTAGDAADLVNLHPTFSLCEALLSSSRGTSSYRIHVLHVSSPAQLFSHNTAKQLTVASAGRTCPSVRSQSSRFGGFVNAPFFSSAEARHSIWYDKVFLSGTEEGKKKEQKRISETSSANIAALSKHANI